MRDTLFPPPSFFAANDPATAPAARRVHQICNKATWQSLGFGGKLYAGLLVLAWPFIAAVGAFLWLRRNGGSIRAMTGKSGPRHFVEMLRLAIHHRIPPKYYYMFE